MNKKKRDNLKKAMKIYEDRISNREVKEGEIETNIRIKHSKEDREIEEKYKYLMNTIEK
jgi:hypothetical protein